MSIIDSEIEGGPLGKIVTGISVTQPSALNLSVSSGSITIASTSQVLNFTSQNHTFSPDASFNTVILMSIITDDGTNVDLWVDVFSDDGSAIRGAIPSGFTEIIDLAFGTIAPNETDLSNSGTNIFRRVWV